MCHRKTSPSVFGILLSLDRCLLVGAPRCCPIDTIMDFLDKHNENPKIFTWTKDADTILAKVAKCKEASGAGH